MRPSRYARTLRWRGGSWGRGSVPLIALCICGGGLGVGAGVLLLFWIVSAGAAGFGPTPSCAGPARVRVFVVDSSDPPISPSQAVAIDALVKRFLDEGRFGDRV